MGIVIASPDMITATHTGHLVEVGTSRQGAATYWGSGIVKIFSKNLGKDKTFSPCAPEDCCASRKFVKNVICLWTTR